MIHKLRILVGIGFCLMGALAASGCGDGGDDDDAPAVDLTGTWRATYAEGYNLLTMVQSGDAVTGTYADSDGGRGTITGTVEGSRFSFTILETPADGGRTWGTADIVGNTMMGGFSNTYGDIDEPFTAVKQ